VYAFTTCSAGTSTLSSARENHSWHRRQTSGERVAALALGIRQNYGRLTGAAATGNAWTRVSEGPRWGLHIRAAATFQGNRVRGEMAANCFGRTGCSRDPGRPVRGRGRMLTTCGSVRAGATPRRRSGRRGPKLEYASRHQARPMICASCDNHSAAWPAPEGALCLSAALAPAGLARRLVARSRSWRASGSRSPRDPQAVRAAFRA